MGHIKTSVVFLLISLSMLLAAGTALAAPQYDIYCNSCHNMPPDDSGDGSRNPDTGAVKGNHAKHSGSSVSACAKCHGDASGYVTGHRDGMIQFTTNINSSPATGAYKGGVAFVNQTSVPANGTCSNVNCHFEATTPTWGATPWVNDGSNCNKCHGNGSTAAPQTGAHPGTGSKHGTYYGLDTASCLKCHPNNATFSHATSAAHHTIAVQFSGSNASGSYTGGATAYPNYLPSVGATPNGSCANLYCHSDGKATPGAPRVTPTWSGTLPSDCSGCHGSKSTATTSLTGAHNKHMNDATGGGAFGCVDCHAKTVSDNTTVSTTANHVNGFVTYSGANAGANKNCANFYCHSNGKGSFTAPPAWTGTGSGCNTCHASGNLTNSHPKHIAQGYSCDKCHSLTTTNGTTISDPTKHINRTLDVQAGGTVTFNYSAGSCTNLSCHFNTSSSFTWGSAALNCDSCHPKAQLPGAHAVHMGALNTVTQVTFYNYTGNHTPANSDATRQYGFGCANCHPMALSSHNNGLIDVALTSDTGISTLRARNAAGAAYSGGTARSSNGNCTNVYCHGDGINTPSNTTPNWNASFTGDRCANCHGNAPTSNAHSMHQVGIHYDDIYNGVSGKMKAGVNGKVSHGVAARATTISCNICHANTVTSAANDKNTVCASCHDGVKASQRGNASIGIMAAHVNGKVDVAFATVNVASRAQVRNESFFGYSANFTRKNGLYKNYTTAYDVAKKSLNTSTWTVGGAQGQSSCANVACHVGNQVQWNASLTCDNCHSRL